MKTCLILDYGVGNISSIRSFFRERNYLVSLGNNVDDIRKTDLLILPGVGSFNVAIDNIIEKCIGDEIQDRHFANKPILGICLGLHILTNNSAESPNSIGLGVFNCPTMRLKELSRIGWGKINFKSENQLLSNEHFFFNHSYGIYDFTDSAISASSGFSNYQALLITNKTVGVQFHPEKSQKSGNMFLNWLEAEIWNLND